MQQLSPHNANHGLAPANGVVSVLSSETGLPVAVPDAGWIARVRTAGLSATQTPTMPAPITTM